MYKIGRNYKDIGIENIMNISFVDCPRTSVTGQLQRIWYTVRFEFYVSSRRKLLQHTYIMRRCLHLI